MNTYIILRRNGWATRDDLEKAASRSSRVGFDEMREKIRWVRSFITRGETSRLGLVCVYEAVDVETIREHARLAQLPCDAIVPVCDLFLGKDDIAAVMG